MPSLDEQIAINKYIDIQCESYNEAIIASMKMNTLLQERRTALISAAVTGKIDVRGWQPPEPTTTGDA